MSAGRRHFECAFSALLALDIGEIERGAGGLENFRLRSRQDLGPLEVIGELDERRSRDDLDVGARPGGFRTTDGGAHQPLAAGIRADGGGKHARDRRDRTIETKFAQDGESRQRIMRNGADRRHQAKRDRQVIMAAFLGKVGRREVDGDAARRERKTGGDQCRAHPFARLRNRLVRQSHDGERRHSGRHLHLDIDRPHLDALERNRGDALDHVRPCPERQSSGT